MVSVLMVSVPMVRFQSQQRSAVQATKELYCVEGCGIPKPAEAVVQERANALAAAQKLGQQAAGNAREHTRACVHVIQAAAMVIYKQYSLSRGTTLACNAAIDPLLDLLLSTISGRPLQRLPCGLA